MRTCGPTNYVVGKEEQVCVANLAAAQGAVRYVCSNGGICRTAFELEPTDMVRKRWEKVTNGEIEIPKYAYYAECPTCHLPVFLFEEDAERVVLAMPSNTIGTIVDPVSLPAAA